MKFNKMMTKVLSALIMVSMVGTSVQVPTLAEVTNAGRAIVAGTVEDKAKDASGSTESKDAGAADDEDNKNQNDAENAENNEQAAASDSNAQNNTENSSKAEQTLRLFQVQKIIPLHRLLITIYHHLILQIILQVLHRYLNLSQRITTAISFLLIKISHYSHISDKHKHFQQSLQMVTVATLSGKLNRSSSQFQHRK